MDLKAAPSHAYLMTPPFHPDTQNTFGEAKELEDAKGSALDLSM
jgi:hypothetical protein